MRLLWLIYLLAVLQSAFSTLTLDDYLNSQLESFEILDPVRIISKRSLSDDSPINLHFQALNRSFQLVLWRGYSGSAASAGITVQVVRKNSVEHFNASGLFSDFLHGHVNGQPNSYVSGFFADDGLHLTIQDGVDTVTIDPMSFVSGNQSDKRVLVYDESSIKPSEHICGFSSQLNRSLTSQRQQFYPPPGYSRHRRATAGEAAGLPLTRVCRLQLVADHTFVKHIASGNVGSTVKCLIKIADDINQVYQATKFLHPETGEVFTGIGFELANLRVFEDSDIEADHFNAAVPPIAGYQYVASPYLEAFGDYEKNKLDLSSYCLNHLVTFRPMQLNILGLAYLGSQYPNYIGGICSLPSQSTSGRKRSIGRNIGMTTYANKDGNPILSRQALLVSAHELGHNMGSEHDPIQAGVCSPTWADGGPYLMYQIAVTGNADHHSRFSDCSSKQIAVVIKARQQGCFSDPRNAFCGNRRREEGEECDAGSEGDECCNSQCRLRSGKTCTDVNYPCCLKCKPAPAGTLCQRQSPLHPCQANATCDGSKLTCPVANYLPDGTPCQFDVGACHSGKCESVCSQIGQQPCSCQNEADSCLVCCQPVQSSSSSGNAGGATRCAPFTRRVNLPPNQPCPIGRCLANGTCQKLEPGSGQLIVRLWNLIVQSGSNSVATFLWKNMVFSVIIISLLLWIPACCIIAFQDRLDAKKGYESALA